MYVAANRARSGSKNTVAGSPEEVGRRSKTSLHCARDICVRVQANALPQEGSQWKEAGGKRLEGLECSNGIRDGRVRLQLHLRMEARPTGVLWRDVSDDSYI